MNRLFIITIFSLVCLLQIHASNINGSLKEEGIPVNIQEYKTGLQLSKKDLKEKSTEELLDICLGYPYIIDCLFYDSIEEGIDELISEFNGFPELLSRTDAVKTMLSKLLSFHADFEKIQQHDRVSKGGFSFRYLVLEMLLVKKSEISEQTMEQKRIIMNMMDSCLSVKVKFPETFGKVCQTPYSLMERQLSSDRMSPLLRNYIVTPTTIYTPKGSIVPDTYIIDGDDYSLSPDELSSLQNDLYNNYDGAQLVAPPSIKYNCHAYAWHVYEGGGQVWVGYNTITAENIYWTDGSYKEVSESLSTKISYDESTANHSAIRLSNTWYQSKWGMGPVVKHHPNACPYNTYYPKKYYKRNSSLSGPSYVYESAVFTVNNIEYGSSLTWVLSGSNDSCFILEPGVPSANQCRITRNDSVEYYNTNFTLKALITYEGAVIDTISKQIIAPYINGPTIPCNHTEYSVIGRPNNSTVTWSTNGQGLGYDIDPYWQLEVDPNDYVITNYNGGYIYGTLTANVIENNQVVGVLQKHIDTTGGFSGTWYQEPSLLDSTNTVPQAFSHMSILEIVSGRKVYLMSDDFNSTSITHSETGFSILGWNNSNGVISFTPIAAPNSLSGSIVIRGSSSNGCRNFKFSLRRPVNPILLTASPSEEVCHFSISEKEDANSSTNTRLGNSPEWLLTITQSDTGRTVYESAVSGKSKTVGIKGWDSGIYIATAQVGAQYISCKFAVPK